MKQEMMGWQWHQLDNMQIICTGSRHTSMPAHRHPFFTGRMLFLMPAVKALKAK